MARKTSKRSYAGGQVAAVVVQRCNGKIFDFHGPFVRGEVSELIRSYRRAPKSPTAACQIGVVDHRDNTLARYERWQEHGGRWRRTS